MEKFAKKIFLNKPSISTKENEEESNLDSKKKREKSANYVKIPLSIIENNSNFAKGLPIKCISCGGVLNLYSKINLDFNKQPPVWICDYCDAKNELHIEVSEIPSQAIQTYILENKNNVPIKF